MQVPVYLFTGFLESGKTTFILDTIQDEGFSEGEKTLVIACEEGIEEYDEELLKRCNTVLEVVEEESMLSKELFQSFQKKHKPKQICIEYNGTWKMDTIMDTPLPRGWVLAEILSTVDASTFENYMSNMRSMMLDQFSQSDVVIFNRCKPDMPKASYGRSIKAINRRAKFIYENEDGTIDNNVIEELPFDINADVIEIADEDYAIWYIDAMDHPEKYAGKTVSFTAIVFKSKEFGKNCFVPGRHAMICCEDDINFLGFICKCDNAEAVKMRQWVKITAEIKIEYVRQYEGEGPVLYAKLIEGASKPEEDLVYL